MAIIKSISISKEFDELQKEHQISWTEAARVGMSVLLAEKGVAEYDNNLNLYRRMRAYQKMVENAEKSQNKD